MTDEKQRAYLDGLLSRAGVQLALAEREFVYVYASTRDSKLAAINSGLTAGGLLDPETAAGEALKRKDIQQAIDIVQRATAVETSEVTRDVLLRQAKQVFDLAIADDKLGDAMKALTFQAEITGIKTNKVELTVTQKGDPANWTTEELEAFLRQRRVRDSIPGEYREVQQIGLAPPATDEDEEDGDEIDVTAQRILRRDGA